jgi:hypothetical protein
MIERSRPGGGMSGSIATRLGSVCLARLATNSDPTRPHLIGSTKRFTQQVSLAAVPARASSVAESELDCAQSVNESLMCHIGLLALTEF